MRWFIQDGGMSFAGLDRNVSPLVATLGQLGREWTAIGYHVESESITGLEDADLGIPSVVYGSTRVAELAGGYGFFPGAFYRPEWFDPMMWTGKRADLLNPTPAISSIGDLRRDWVAEPMFVKSIAPKILTGMVLEGSDVAWWLEEYASLADDEAIVVSPVQAIEREWRFFVIDRKVVAGSQYRHDGILRIREPIPANVWEQARKMAEDWLPSPNIVMDICLLPDGSFRLVEFNCLGASGFYAADIARIVEALDDFEKKHFAPAAK